MTNPPQKPTDDSKNNDELALTSPLQNTFESLGEGKGNKSKDGQHKATDDMREALKNFQTSTPNAFAGVPTSIPLSMLLSDLDIDKIIALFATQTAQLKQQVLQAIGEDEDCEWERQEFGEMSRAFSIKETRNLQRADLRAAIEQVFKEVL